VLKNCLELLAPFLLQILRAALKLRVYANKWREVITCVIHKPGKSNYDVPKAYRSITLLNTIVKLFSAVIAEEITYLAEKFQLLPANHFGRRPGHTTMDSLHLLIDTMKAVWRRKQLVSVLSPDPRCRGGLPKCCLIKTAAQPKEAVGP